MAAYAVTDWVSVVTSLAGALALMETKLETVDDAKTIRYIDVKKTGSNQFQGVLIYDA